MTKSIVAAVAALALAAPAYANGVERTPGAPAPQGLNDAVVVETHRNTAGVIVGDAVGGAVAGAAVGGGVALYNRYLSDSKSWGNWQQDLLIGAGIGLGVGLVFGVVDAASTPDRAYVPGSPVAERRETGFEQNWAAWSGRF